MSETVTLARCPDMSHYTDLRELAAEARAALRAWGPPTPDHDNPLYYPLLFLTEKVEAVDRHVLRQLLALVSTPASPPEDRR